MGHPLKDSVFHTRLFARLFSPGIPVDRSSCSITGVIEYGVFSGLSRKTASLEYKIFCLVFRQISRKQVFTFVPAMLVAGRRADKVPLPKITSLYLCNSQPGH
jgi:hypothetical protein